MGFPKAKRWKNDKENRNTFSYSYACFSCRKVFRHKNVKDSENVICPQCSGKLWFTGTAFKAPRKDNVHQWLKVEELIKNGTLFFREGVIFPEKLKEVSDFIKSRHKRNPGEQLLEKIDERKNKAV